MYEVALALSLLIYLAVVVTYLRSRFFSVFHPFTLYAMFHGLVFVLRPVLSVWLDYQYVYRAYSFTPTSGDRTVALLAATLGFLAFAFFSFRPGSGAVEMRFSPDPMLQDERHRLSRHFFWAVAICALLRSGRYGASSARRSTTKPMPIWCSIAAPGLPTTPWAAVISMKPS